MPRRKVPLIKYNIYHIYNKSIANFKIFNSPRDYDRIINEISFYAMEDHFFKSPFCKQYSNHSTSGTWNGCLKKCIDIIAYCIMPTHFHLILKGLNKGGITKFTNSIQKSYSQYFNIKHNRKGPLWQGRFNNVLIENDEQLIHLTRYIHINPVKSRLIRDPKDFDYSSYKEYIGLVKEDKRLCNFSDYFEIEPCHYEKFVKDEIDYMRSFEKIKHLILE